VHASEAHNRSVRDAPHRPLELADGAAADSTRPRRIKACPSLP